MAADRSILSLFDPSADRGAAKQSHLTPGRRLLCRVGGNRVSEASPSRLQPDAAHNPRLAHASAIVDEQTFPSMKSKRAH
jgi:hypothetical protein